MERSSHGHLAMLDDGVKQISHWLDADANFRTRTDLSPPIARPPRLAKLASGCLYFNGDARPTVTGCGWNATATV